MTDLQAAREAAERLLGLREVDYVMTDYRETVQAEEDIQAVGRALLAVLADPTVLLKPPEWEPHPKRPNCWWWATILGEYYAEPPLNNGETEWDWRLSGEPWREAPSLSAAQSACESDFRERIRGAFQETKTAPGAGAPRAS